MIFSSWFLSWNDVFSDQAGGGNPKINTKRLGSVGFFNPRNTPFISRWNNPLIRSPLILTNFQRHGTSKYNTLGSPQRYGFRLNGRLFPKPKTKMQGMNFHIPPLKLSFLLMFPSFIFWRAEEGLSTLISGQPPKRTAKNMKKEWSHPASFSAMSPSIKLEESETIHFKPKLHFKKGLPTVSCWSKKGVVTLEAYTEDSVERTMVYQFSSNRNVKRFHTSMEKRRGVFLFDATGEKLKHKTRGGFCFDRKQWNNFSTRREQ